MSPGFNGRGNANGADVVAKLERLKFAILQRPAPPRSVDGTCVRPGVSSPIPHSQPLKGLWDRVAGTKGELKMEWKRRGGMVWLGFTFSGIQGCGGQGILENREKEEGCC